MISNNCKRPPEWEGGHCYTNRVFTFFTQRLIMHHNPYKAVGPSAYGSTVFLNISANLTF